MPEPNLHPLIISAPFGNYVQPAGCTATLGTYTAAARSGRVWRIVKTVRFYPRIGAWVNKIGLRNPGVDWYVNKVDAGAIEPADKIVSIHGFDDADWQALLAKVAATKPGAIELNMSCPNIGEIDWPADLFERALGAEGGAVPVIAKLPPVNYREMTRQAVEAGVKWFHCTNTLPVPAGGVSGRPLKPVALQCIRELRHAYGSAISIIGGGGIYTAADVDDFAAAGADCFAVGTKVMNPVYLFGHGGLRGIMKRAGEKARKRVEG